MAAYGLYSHIASNKRRSVVLLVGLFFLIYLMVFAGALLAEGFMRGNLPVDAIIAPGLARSDRGVSFRHGRDHPLDPDRI